MMRANADARTRTRATVGRVLGIAIDANAYVGETANHRTGAPNDGSRNDGERRRER